MKLCIPYNGIEARLRNTCRNAHVEEFFSQYLAEFMKRVDPSTHNYRKLSPDMKKEYKEFYRQRGFKDVSTKWMEYYYTVTGDFDPRYIPDDIFNMYIDPVFPNIRSEWQNKAYQNKILPDVRFPHTIVASVKGTLLDDANNQLSVSEAISIIRKYDSVIIKPSVYSGGGTDVTFCKSSEVTETFLKKYGAREEIAYDYVIQEIIEQSDLMAVFNPTSVNTDKILSFYFNGEVHILSAHIRIGNEGSKIDNASATFDSWYVGVNDDGSLCEKANTSIGAFSRCTRDGIAYSNITIDWHQKCIDIIMKAHVQLPQFPIISWDFAQGKDGEPILIEYNLKYHSLIHFQLHSGPIFGDMTDEVLELARKNRENNPSMLYQFK